MNFSENLRRWIDRSDIDYYTQFIKVWIPFNAWYKTRYPNADTDRAVINEIKRNSNLFKDNCINYLRTETQEAQMFRNYLGELHSALNLASIKNNEEVLSFEAIVIERNEETDVDENRNGARYFIRRTDGNRNRVTNVAVAVTKDSGRTTLFSKQQSDYDWDEIENDQDFQQLTKTRRDNLRGLYPIINPNLPINLLERNSDSQVTLCGTCRFIANKETISKGLIEMLYLLRCTLFHGELVPNDDANMVYKYAYELLALLLPRLR